MSILVSSGGSDDLHPKGPPYCSPRKRSRLSSYQWGGEKKHKQEPCSVDSLPDECIFEILRRLPGARERSNSACVSKRWLMILSSISASQLSFKAKKSLNISKKPLPGWNLADVEAEGEEVESMGCITRCLEDREVTDVRVAAAAVGAAGFGGLGKLVIRGSHSTRGLTNAGLSAVAQCCPSLKVLSMWKVPFVDDDGLSELASGCPLLEKLDLHDCPLISSKGLIAVAERCPNLASLALDHCVNIGNEGLQAIGRSCPKLQCVSIKDCPLVGDQGIAGLMSSASSSLTKLKLQNLSTGDLALACIGHYGKAITELCLVGLQNIAERGFWCLGNAMNMHKLRSIVITSCGGVTDAGLTALARGCPSLKQLCLRKCCYLSDAGLKSFVETARSLESLQLEECHRITLAGILAGLVNCNGKLKTLSLAKCLGIKDTGSCPDTLPACESLRCLTVRDCPGFTSTSLAAVGEISPNLTHLDLSGLVGITDAGLIPLIRRSDSGLIKVGLRGCVNLTDSSVLALVKEHGDTLQVLNLEGCNRITDQILLAISQQCTQLEELDMSSADITDYGIALLASARHLNLRILSFSGCSKVTPRSLPLFGNIGPTLVGLNLQKCNLIKAHGIASLEEKMWWCDIIA